MNMIMPTKSVRNSNKPVKKREKAGRPSSFESKKSIASVLRGERRVSRFLMLQLVEEGYITPTKTEKTGKRGRPAVGYLLTPKGKSLVTLSKNWFGHTKHEDNQEITDEAIVQAAELIEGNENVSDDEVHETLADALSAADEIEAIQAAQAQGTVSTVEGSADILPAASNENEETAAQDEFEVA